MSLPAAFETFAAQPADLASARALSYDRAAGLALVTALAERKLRSHLEALGEVSPDKEVKKAARAAAYKLKSAGVAGGVQREASIDLSVKIETQGVAAATAPGPDGRLHLVLPSLPGHGGGELDLRDDDKLRAEPLAELAVGRIRRFVADNVADKTFQPPLLIDLDLAARLVEAADAALTAAEGIIPANFAHFRGWANRARAFGADPARASARAALGPAGRPVPEAVIDDLAKHPRLGYIAAPGSAFKPIDKEFRGLLHGKEAIERADFDAQAQALIERAAAGWWASPGQRKAAQLWLDATADVLWAGGDEAMAKVCLALSDDLGEWAGEPLAHPLLHKAFVGAIDLEHAWQHREAHVHGHAHHD